VTTKVNYYNILLYNDVKYLYLVNVLISNSLLCALCSHSVRFKYYVASAINTPTMFSSPDRDTGPVTSREPYIPPSIVGVVKASRTIRWAAVYKQRYWVSFFSNKNNYRNWFLFAFDDNMCYIKLHLILCLNLS